MGQARRTSEIPESDVESRRSVPAQSGTIRIDEGEMRAARSALRDRILAAGIDDLGIDLGDDDEDTETTLPGVPVHEPVRDTRSGADVVSDEPLCAVVTPGAFSRDPATGKRTALLMVRSSASCALLDSAPRRSEAT